MFIMLYFSYYVIIFIILYYIILYYIILYYIILYYIKLYNILYYIIDYTGYGCHCDYNDYTWRTDTGNITEKEKLPIRRVQWGGQYYDTTLGFETVGPLKCVQGMGCVYTIERACVRAHTVPQYH